MNRIVYFILFSVFFIFASITPPSMLEAEEGVCIEKGVVVRNLTTVDLWYKRDGGDCFKWKQNKIFVIRPDDSIELFSDMVCATRFCKEYMDYEFYRSSDTDRDCRVRILPGCNVSDM